MKNRFVVRGFAAMSLVVAFMFVGCSDDSLFVGSDEESVTDSSSSAKPDGKPNSSSSKKLSSSSSKKELSSSSKKLSSSSSKKEFSSSSKREEKSSSSFIEDDEIIPSSPEIVGAPVNVPTQQDANITLSSELVGEGLLTNSRLSGDDMRFKGRFGLDISQDPSEDNINIQFTNIEYKVLDTENRNVAVTITSNTVTPTANDIDLNSINSAGVMVNMTDPGFTACGKYNLMVTVMANNGAKDFFSTVLIPFERDAAEYCRDQNQDPGHQQPVKQEIPMSFCEVVVSTNMNPGLDFASCTAVPAPATTADIIFSKVGTRDNPEVTATSGNGTQFAQISNGDLLPSDDDYEVNMWPEDMNPDRTPATAYVSDFKYRTLGPQLTGMIENSNQIYVAATAAYNKDTGAGFYAFAITDPSQGNNGDYTLTLKVYRVE